MTAEPLRFPDGFLWGTATSAYQVEGNNRNNQWWAWEQEGGHIRDGSVCGIACDHYHRFDEDFALMESLGFNAHRFSIEWSRIQPEDGRWDEKEVEHYRRVVESVRGHGMVPLVTLHHFTDPLWFDARGGWTRPDAPDYLARYAGYMARALGDAVPFWLTINEPSVVPAAGFLLGEFPPQKRDLALAMTVARNFLIALGKMHHAIKENASHNPAVGPVINMTYVEPAGDSDADRRAAELLDAYANGVWFQAFTDGVIGPPLGDGEPAEGLKGAWDFVGVNYYSRTVVRAGRPPAGLEVVPPEPEAETSTMGWEVSPEGFYRCLKRAGSYGLPVYITENGIGTNDDEQRCRYIVRHLAAAHRALGEGVDIRSYLHWCFQDNFEWTWGYSQRFGIVERPVPSLERVLKPSAHLLSRIARANAVPAALVERYLGG